MLSACVASSHSSEHQPAMPRRRRARSRSSSFGGAAADSLALPSLGAIEPALRGVTDQAKWAVLALRWMEAGYLDEATPFDEPHKLVERAISTWVQEHCGAIQHIGFSHSASCMLAGILGSGSPFYDDHEEKDVWFFWTVAEGAPWRTLRPRLEALDAVCPGFSEKVIFGLDIGAWRADVPILTPYTLRGMCSQYIWYGSSTQEEWIDEMEGMGASGEDIEGAFCPKDLDEAMPKAISDPAPTGFTSKNLRRIAKRYPQVADVAECLIEIAKAIESKEELAGDLRDTELELSVMTAVLRWDHDDLTARVVDDLDYTLAQYENQTDITGIETVPLDPTGFTNWLERRSRTLRLIQTIDRLVGLVSVPSEG